MTGQALALLPVRAMMGIGFVIHGAPKLFSSQQHESFVAMLQAIGVPVAGLMAWVVGIVEFFGGLALLIGVLVVPVAALLIINMLVAMFTVHLPQGFNFIQITGMTEQSPQFAMPGYEVNLLYIAGLLSLFLGGSGPLSLDAVRRRRHSTEA